MSWLAQILVIFAITEPVIAQTARPRDGFHWNWRAAKELSAELSLRDSSLPQKDKDAIAELIEAELGPDIADLRKAALDTRIQLVDLNGDGVPEVVAQAMADCSPTGNCDFWVFRKTRQGYKPLLEDLGQTFTIQKTGANHFAEIVIAMHGSATDSELKDYRYENGRYRWVGSYDASWEVQEADGSVHELKEPHVTRYGTGFSP